MKVAEGRREEEGETSEIRKIYLDCVNKTDPAMEKRKERCGRRSVIDGVGV